MKAYKTIDDESDVRLFRPELNMKRLKNSMDRLAMPGTDFVPEELIRCIGELVRVGKLACACVRVCVRVLFGDEC